MGLQPVEAAMASEYIWDQACPRTVVQQNQS